MDCATTNGNGSGICRRAGVGHIGVTAQDNRRFVEAVLYRYRAGISWRDLSERFGDWKEHASAVQPLGQEGCGRECLSIWPLMPTTSTR